MSNVKLLVITLLPAVTPPVSIVAVAPEFTPVIVSPAVKSVTPNPPIKTYCNGLEVVISLPLAPEVPPVILSPLSNIPVTFETVSVGAVASVDVSSESNTALSLNTSARPNEIILSVGLVPNASVVPVVTFSCFIN